MLSISNWKCCMPTSFHERTLVLSHAVWAAVTNGLQQCYMMLNSRCSDLMRVAEILKNACSTQCIIIIRTPIFHWENFADIHYFETKSSGYSRHNDIKFTEKWLPMQFLYLGMTPYELMHPDSMEWTEQCITDSAVKQWWLFLCMRQCKRWAQRAQTAQIMFD